MLIRHQFIPIASGFIIALICASCGSETNKENATEAHQTTKISLQAKPKTNREVIAPPTLSLIESPALHENNLASFGFRSLMAGTISYSGGCFGPTKNAIKGNQHILLGSMVEGTYDECAIQVTDEDGNKSEPLRVPTFKVDFTATELSQIGGFRIKGRRAKIEIKASESGTLVYSGNCNGDLQHTKQGKSEVTISFPGDGQYNDCEIFLRDASGKISKPLALGTVRIDATPPVLAEIKPVPDKIQTNRPSYSFKTSKTGTLSFSGKCRGNVDKAVTGINHIALLTAEPGSYNDCTMTLTDSSKNQSQPLKISSFVVMEGQS